MSSSKIVDIKGGRASESPAAVDGDTKTADTVANTADQALGADPTREYNRIPWSGNLDEDEISRPGGLLLAALYQCAIERRQQLNDMAKELGVTYGYINQLRNGIRLISQVSDDFTLACARYLGVPRFTVMMLAGRVTPEDLFEVDSVMASEVTRAMAFICQDPKWGPLITPEQRMQSLQSQYTLVRLYEEATQRKLMDSRLDPAILVGHLEKLQEEIHSRQTGSKRATEKSAARERRQAVSQS